MPRYSNPGSSTISAAAPGISAGRASCIPSGVPIMPIGGTAWICGGITTWMAGLFGAWGFTAPAGLFGAWRSAARAGLFGAWRSPTPAGSFGPWTFAGACWTRSGVPGINIGLARWLIAEIFAGGCRYLGPMGRTF